MNLQEADRLTLSLSLTHTHSHIHICSHIHMHAQMHGFKNTPTQSPKPWGYTRHTNIFSKWTTHTSHPALSWLPSWVLLRPGWGRYSRKRCHQCAALPAHRGSAHGSQRAEHELLVQSIACTKAYVQWLIKFKTNLFVCDTRRCDHIKTSWPL